MHTYVGIHMNVVCRKVRIYSYKLHRCPYKWHHLWQHLMRTHSSHELCVFPRSIATTANDSEAPSRRVELSECIGDMGGIEVAAICFPPLEQLSEYFHFASMNGDDGGGHFLSRFISLRTVDSVCLPCYLLLVIDTASVVVIAVVVTVFIVAAYRTGGRVHFRCRFYCRRCCCDRFCNHCLLDYGVFKNA